MRAVVHLLQYLGDLTLSIPSIPSPYVANLCSLLNQEGDIHTAQALIAGTAAFSASKLSEIESQNLVLHKENASKAEHYQDWTNAVAFQQEVLAYTQAACGLIHFETLEAMFTLCYYLRKMGAATDAMDTLLRLLRIVRTHLGSEHQLHAKALAEIQLIQQSLERAQGFANLSQHFDPVCAITVNTNQPILSKRVIGREVCIIEKLLDRGRLVWARAVFRSWVDASMTDSMCNEDELIEQIQKLSQIFLQNHDLNSAEVCFRSVVRLCNRCNIFGDKSQDLRNALMDWTRCLHSMKKQDWSHDALMIFKYLQMD
jgi:hypothetical protein